MAELVPTDRELDALKVLWQRGPSTVREIGDAVNQQGAELAYTTQSWLHAGAIEIDEIPLVRVRDCRPDHTTQPASGIAPARRGCPSRRSGPISSFGTTIPRAADHSPRANRSRTRQPCLRRGHLPRES